MAQSVTSKNKKVMKTLVLAAASIGLYTALFANEGLVTEVFTKGGSYAAFPVFTALVFSFVHGAFASQCLDTLGLTPRKTTVVSETVTRGKKPEVKKDRRPRLNVR